MAELKSLEDLFEHLLQDMYYAEHKIKIELPKMAEKAANDDLKSGFEQHERETEEQITILEKVFEMTEADKGKEKCEAIEGLLKEGRSLCEEAEEGAVRDAALIAAAQKIEHYEIASYGMMCLMAKTLGYNEAAKQLHKILEQEKATDEKLSELAHPIDEDAMQEAA